LDRGGGEGGEGNLKLFRKGVKGGKRVADPRNRTRSIGPKFPQNTGGEHGTPSRKRESRFWKKDRKEREGSGACFKGGINKVNVKTFPERVKKKAVRRGTNSQNHWHVKKGDPGDEKANGRQNTRITIKQKRGRKRWGGNSREEKGISG